MADAMFPKAILSPTITMIPTNDDRAVLEGVEKGSEMVIHELTA
jgi:hypothetical protein